MLFHFKCTKDTKCFKDRPVCLITFHWIRVIMFALCTPHIYSTTVPSVLQTIPLLGNGTCHFFPQYRYLYWKNQWLFLFCANDLFQQLTLTDMNFSPLHPKKEGKHPSGKASFKVKKINNEAKVVHPHRPWCLCHTSIYWCILCCGSGRTGKIERRIHPGVGQHERKVLTFTGKFQEWWKLLMSQNVLDKAQSSKSSVVRGKEGRHWTGY